MMRRKRILYIDDEADLQWLVRHILETLGGYEIQACGSGAEGLRLAGEFSPDLILLDVMMPDMDGFSVLSALRAQPDAVRVPVVFVTARPQLTDEYLRGGAQGVIAKPFEPEYLVERVRVYTQEALVA